MEDTGIEDRSKERREKVGEERRRKKNKEKRE